MILLKNCRLITELTEGFSGTEADILLEGKHIKKIVSPGSLSEDENWKTYDLEGKTVLPGFFDLHAHLMFVNQDYNALVLRSQNQYLMDGIGYAKSYLLHGYTTIRDCGNDFYIGPTIRDGIEACVIDGPRVITAGKIISPTAKGNISFGALYQEIDDPAEMLGVCRTEVSHHVDFIKYMVTGAVLNESGVPGELVTTAEEIRAIVDAAATLNTYVAAHCHGTEGIRLAIIHGIRTIEHASYLDEECVELIQKYHCRSSLVPTLSISYSLNEHLYGGDIRQEFIDKSIDAYTHMKSGIEMAETAGIAVGWGTDIDRETFEAYPGLEFMARSQIDITNVQILKQATINSAKIAGIDHLTGSIREGKFADLVVIDGHPDEDLRVMKKLPEYVFKEGKEYIEVNRQNTERN